MVRDGRRRHSAGDGALEVRLREGFAREIAAQAGRAPALNAILLMAKIDALNRRRARVAAIESWSEILVLGTIATLSAVWWEDLISGLEALFPTASASLPWTPSLGVAAGLVAILLLWSKTLVRLR